jgi:hypothetical protein
MRAVKKIKLEVSNVNSRAEDELPTTQSLVVSSHRHLLEP